MSEHASDEQPPAKEPKVEDPKSATISPTESGNFGPIAPEELITSAQVNESLSLKEQNPTAWRCDKRGPAFIKIGRAVWYRRADIAPAIGDDPTRSMA